MTDACNPAIDGTWKNFKVNYGAVGDGVTNDSGALDAWLADGAATKLYMPPTPGAFYKLSGTNTLTHGKSTAIISGWGAIIDNAFIGGADPDVPQNDQNSARLHDVAIGATSATLITAGNISRFAVGNWVILCGVSLDPSGYPPNWQYQEKRQITNIVGAVVFWSAPTVFAYKAAWPLTAPGNASNADHAGPATMYLLASGWNTDVSVFGLRITQSGNTNVHGRSLVLCGMYFDGFGPAISMSEMAIVRRTQIGRHNEVDKNNSYVEYDLCTAITEQRIDVQSGSNTQLVIKNTPLTTLLGTAQNTAISGSGSVIGEVRVGASGYGASRSVHLAADCAIGSFIETGVLLNLSSQTLTFSAGTFTVANTEASEVWRCMVPGFKYYYLYYDGSRHKTNDLGNVISFEVLAIRQDGTNTYVDTDLSATPTVTYLGSAAANYIGVYAALQTSGPAGLTALQAPLPAPADRSFAISLS